VPTGRLRRSMRVFIANTQLQNRTNASEAANASIPTF
jgi:hypothetical protein